MSFAKLISELRECKDSQGSLDNIPAMFWQPNTWGTGFFLEMTRFHWTAIRHIPESEISVDISLEAVSQDPQSLEFVPYELRIYPICKAALEQINRNISADKAQSLLKCIPHDFFQELFIELLEMGVDFSFEMIPHYHLKAPFLIAAIEAVPLFIEEIPIEQQTQDMCAAFLIGGDDDYFLEDVKPEARSRNLCLACLRERRGQAQAVPASLWDDEMRVLLEESH